MIQIEKQYLQLLLDVLAHGTEKDLFNATEANAFIKSTFGRMLRHSFSEGFPIYSSKKVLWAKAIAEMLWFLNPRDSDGTLSVLDLQNMGVRIWDDWAKDSPNIPVHYGNQTNWSGTGLDQTAWVLDELETKPYRKSYIVNSWDPTTVYAMADACEKESVVLPACHYSYQIACQKPDEVSMLLNIRSNDLPIGNPFNVVQYGALLQMYAHCMSNRTGRPWTCGELIISIGDAHIYSSQIEGVREQLNNAHKEYPRSELFIKQRGQVKLQDFRLSDFSLDCYEPESFRKIGTLFRAGGY